MYKRLQFLIEYLSGEWMLTKLGKANGGTIIFLRSLQVAVTLFIVALIMVNLFNPSRGWRFSFEELQIQVIDRISWFGALFAAAYAALYARFSSQWLYLANIYNSIKRTEISVGYARLDKMAEWKAGFMEDAEHLHMAKKRNFAPIINVWGKDPLVKKKYILHTPGGEVRYNNLMESVKDICHVIEKDYP